ncbi:MAG TPA: hypothetical protein VEZ14_09510 [Dehalococcoidia bacterium]|nr:hypothetical protein [Dehalococcoidia bacterium]
MTPGGGRPALLLLPAAVLGSVALIAALLAGPPLTSALLSLSALAAAAAVARAAFVVTASAREPEQDAGDEPLADAPAPRDIFAGDASVYASWYFVARLRDEIERVRAEGGTLCVVRITARSATALDAGRRAARQWLPDTGFAGHIGSAVALVLPGAAAAEGRALAARIQPIVRGLRIDLRVCPDDGLTMRELLGADASEDGEPAAA